MRIDAYSRAGYSTNQALRKKIHVDPQKNDRSPKEQPPINKPDPGSQIQPNTDEEYSQTSDNTAPAPSPGPQKRSRSHQAPSAPQKADESTPSDHTFKPLRIAYAAKRSVVWLALFAFVGIIILITAGQGVNPLVLLVIAALLVLGAGVDITVSYRKERYRFSLAAILYNTGNVFTDKETELRYKNITHVRLIKPFIEYRLFGTGHILIEAAGSSGTEVEVRSVTDPEAIYTQLQSVMSNNGFSLGYGRLLEQAQPARLAVILEMFGMLTGAAVTLLAVIAPGIIELFGNITALPQPLVATVASVGGLLVIGGGGFFLYATYQDFMRRTYYVYDDVIAYTRGFLTKQKAFIPVESLSDSTLTQTIIDKLLNLYDVVISCQGGGSEISFRNLRQGKQIEETIDQLINEQTTSSKTEPSDHEQPQHAPQTTAAATAPKQIDATQASFKMNAVRTLVPHLLLLPLFILFPPLVLAPIYNYIVVRAPNSD